MRDLYQREIDYMRVSITDRCNLRCRYCMPDGIRCIPMEEILTFEEIVTVCREAAALGIKNIKVTGGEPLVRKGCPDLVRMLKQIPGIEQVTLTTNGILLADFAEELKEAGLDAVNISLDTLDAAQFETITGSEQLNEVREGLEKALELHMKVKTNTVLQPGLNENVWQDMLELARNNPLDVRFIEMMPIGQGKGLQSVSNDTLRRQIEKKYNGLTEDLSLHGNGPAVYYNLPGFTGSVGFISAIHGKFCSKCNRIRMTAEGMLKPCLCFDEGISIKKSVRNADIKNVRRILEQAIGKKPLEHCFEEKDTITEKRKMAQIGG